MRKRAYLYLILSIAVSAFILFTSTNSGADHSSIGGRTIEWINEVFFNSSLSGEEKSSIVGVAAKLFGHFSLFLLDGVFTRLFLKETKLKRGASVVFFLLYGFLLSCFGEIVQIFSEGRYPSPFDVALDFMGFLFPFLFLDLLDKKEK